ncbi:MAG: hypothetical protein A2W74_08160 [Planctomycetes bacterium RIFCSPLOWO2_12_38_17]|nr:MAG: hypothetical protein A2W74_08160 [Planctomycetes bacterium RIFCSPLOWO2_12_38_17]
MEPKIILRVAGYFVIFWMMQAVAQVLLKWGSTSESRWWLGFLVGNLFGFSSTLLLMLLYKDLNPNVALGFATGGSFLASQIAIGIFFNTKLALAQYFGVVVITIGLLAFLIG